MSSPKEIARRRGRSHPPSLLRLAERLIRDEELIARGDVVLCACSGGPDSTALLHVLARLRSKLGFKLVAHGVDHGLRAEAAEELALTARNAASLGVPFATTRVDVAAGGNLQARAREARRGALGAAARLSGARVVATGHTADDRAETFLLRLLRGAGPRGLAVMPAAARLDVVEEARDRVEAADRAVPQQHASQRQASQGEAIGLIRPLLLARRVDVEAHLSRHGLEVARDPSNQETRFLRVRVREELLPLMEGMAPGIVEHLCALAEMLAGERPATGGDVEKWGRAQRLAVARAKKCERPVKLMLAGGREVTVGFAGEESVLMEAEPRGP